MTKKNNNPQHITFTSDNVKLTGTPDNQPMASTEELNGKAIIIASNSSVPFEGVPLPYNVESDDQLKELEKALNIEGSVVICPLIDPSAPVSPENICKYGVKCKVMKIIDIPDGTKNAFLMSEGRVTVVPQLQISESCFIGLTRKAQDKLPKSKENKFKLLMGIIQMNYDYVKNYFQEMAHVQMAPPKELQDNPLQFLNFIIVTSPIPYEERVKMLMKSDLYERGEILVHELDKIKQQIDFRKEIYAKTASEIDKEQREQFLRAQIKMMQNEIGEGEESDINQLIEKAALMNWPDEMNSYFTKEMAKLRRYNPTSPDYALQFTYLDTLLSLPWNNIKESDIDIEKLQQDLDKDHYGLEKIKERIIEHIAVLKLRGNMRSPILCLYGPPGVGKTSLCKSIAESIDRDYARISLGGLHDETQLRGHRRTYVGALPGRIISALSKLESNNPVFVLDEIDKIGNDHRGDPAQALLEVLDPEQNYKFHDNYLDIDYDLSKIFFIATANNISTISTPLLDRMELINVLGYLLEEKMEIAKRHLIPKLLESHGFKRNEIKITDDALRFMIESYTRESGVRKLEKTIARLLRKIAVDKAKGLRYNKTIDEKKALKLLGKEDSVVETYEDDLPVGVVAGLAWTPVGGEILYFESSLSKGKGNLTLTGNLGDVMKESATIALQWVKANADFLKIDPEKFACSDIHLHVPEGAVPKDGPSAGITMVCSIAGSFTGRRMNDRMAMTGETTLRGKVLPVGGVKEKILAAKRAGITNIILSEKNRRDIEDIEKKYISGLKFHYVSTVREVIDIALAPLPSGSEPTVNIAS